MPLYCLLAHIVSGEKSSVILIFVPLNKYKCSVVYVVFSLPLQLPSRFYLYLLCLSMFRFSRVWVDLFINFMCFESLNLCLGV